MIVTLTLNPTVDRTIFVKGLRPGDVHRVQHPQLDPAGKGINVSRMVDRLGWPSIAFGFLGGGIGDLVVECLNEEGVQSHFVRVPGQSRLNVTILDETTGTGTGFYELGPEIDGGHLATLEAEITPWVRACRVLVLAGSLPPGVPDDVYAEYVRLAREAGVLVILDSDGESLRLGVEAGPDLVKPNVKEAERLLSRSIPDLEAAVAAAREIQGRGARVVVLSMGAAGAVCAEGSNVWLAVPPQVVSRSTVGSGDSMVAGLALSIARGDGVVEGLKLGTAAGAATAMSLGTALGTAEDVVRLIPRVRLERLRLPVPG